MRRRGAAIRSACIPRAPGNPESGTLNLPPADLVALSRTSGEMGLVLNPRIESAFWTKGTLARAPLSGGAPRALSENVISADFTPDGSGFGAAVFDRSGNHQLEFPLGTVRVSEPNTISRRAPFARRQPGRLHLASQRRRRWDGAGDGTERRAQNAVGRMAEHRRSRLGAWRRASCGSPPRRRAACARCAR